MSVRHTHVRIHVGITGDNAPHRHPEFELGLQACVASAFTHEAISTALSLPL